MGCRFRENVAICLARSLIRGHTRACSLFDHMDLFVNGEYDPNDCYCLLSIEDELSYSYGRVGM